jgi:membrane fusion protein, multidrug efflux system
MNGRNRIFAVFLLLLAGLGGGISGCSSGDRVPAVAPETVSGVAVIVAQSTTVLDWVESVGTVRAAQSTQIASQTMGNITEIRAQEGDRVQGGQILAAIDDSQPRAAVEQSAAAVTSAQKEVSTADSELALAESTLKRYQQLYDKKSLSPQEFDEIKSRSQAAESRRDMARAGEAEADAALTQSRTSLAHTQIRAPFAGVVTEKKAEAGTFASPGMPLFTLEDTRSYRLETMVDESSIRLVHLGEGVPVFLDSIGSAEIPGKVSQIVLAADPASRGFLVKIQLPANARLRSGLFGKAHFPSGSRSALLIPRTAIEERGQLRGVFVIDVKQIAQLRYVTLGRTLGEQVEVLSGLQQGEKLVASPGDRELGGKQIVPRP